MNTFGTSLNLTDSSCRLILVAVFLASCTTSRENYGSSGVAWIESPKTDDGLCMYIVGRATDCRTPEAAKQAAYQDAVRMAVKRIIVSITNAGEEIDLISRNLILREVEILPNCVHEERTRRGHNCYVQISVPLKEKVRVYEGLAWRQKLTAWWTEAQGMANRGDSQQALALLDRIVADYDKALNPPFGIDDSFFLMAECYERMNMFSKAVEIYDRLRNAAINSATREVARKKWTELIGQAEEHAWLEKFFRRRIAVLAVVGLEGAVRAWPKMRNEAQNWLKQQGGNVVAMAEPGNLEEVAQWDLHVEKTFQYMADAKLDVLLFITANGKIVKRENGEGRQDYRFEGSVKTVVIENRNIGYSDAYSVMGGWNPINEQMCLDVLALNVLKKWKEGFQKTLLPS
jgi:tetratricopeptide (TPR) repeat protein